MPPPGGSRHEHEVSTYLPNKIDEEAALLSKGLAGAINWGSRVALFIIFFIKTAGFRQFGIEFEDVYPGNWAALGIVSQ